MCALSDLVELLLLLSVLHVLHHNVAHICVLSGCPELGCRCVRSSSGPVLMRIIPPSLRPADYHLLPLD